MTVITKEFISIFEEMVRGDRPCPNTTIQYYVDQVRKLRAEHDNLVKRTTDLNSELDSIKTKLIRIEAAADKYVEDIAWSMKKVEDADAADVMKTIAEITRKNVRAVADPKVDEEAVKRNVEKHIPHTMSASVEGDEVIITKK